MLENTSRSARALKLLIEGNQRFSAGLRSIEAYPTLSRIRDLAENGQSPFAIVLTCSDSRVPTEMVFDRGLGDLFVIRVAGNVVAPSQIASIEFAALNFQTPLCVVMGHSQCGAVKAAITHEEQASTNSALPTMHLEKLVSKITPAVRQAARKQSQSPLPHDLLHEATLCNVQRTVRLLKRKSPALEKLQADNRLLILGAYYDLHTGRVQFEKSDLLHSERSPITAIHSAPSLQPQLAGAHTS